MSHSCDQFNFLSINENTSHIIKVDQETATIFLIWSWIQIPASSTTGKDTQASNWPTNVHPNFISCYIKILILRIHL